MEPRGLPIDLEQTEAAIYRALGLLCIEAQIEAFKQEPDASIERVALKLLHIQRFEKGVAHELMTIAAGLRIADDRAERAVLCQFAEGIISGIDQDLSRADLRFACDKIIHTDRLSWNWSPTKLEMLLAGLGNTPPTPYRGPTATLSGTRGKELWTVNLNIIRFLESSAMAARVLKCFEINLAAVIEKTPLGTPINRLELLVKGVTPTP